MVDPIDREFLEKNKEKIDAILQDFKNHLIRDGWKSAEDQRDLIAEDFIAIEYNNDDVDTDRGTWRQRSFDILFKTHQITLSEQDFMALTTAMEKYVDQARADEKFEQEMKEDHDNQIADDPVECNQVHLSTGNITKDDGFQFGCKACGFSGFKMRTTCMMGDAISFTRAKNQMKKHLIKEHPKIWEKIKNDFGSYLSGLIREEK